MGFYNVLQGDAPYLTLPRRSLRDERQLPPGRAGRHRRQPRRARHRRRRLVQRRQRPRGGAARQRDREPEPAGGTNNWYTRTATPAARTAIAPTPRSPGVGSVLRYLSSLQRPVPSRCDPGHYYLLNNYAPGYYGDGTRQSRSVRHSALDAAHDRRRAAGGAAPVVRATTAISGTATWPIPRTARSAQHLLRHLQLLPVLDGDHDQRDGARRAPEGHDGSLRRDRARVAAGGRRSSSRAASSTAIRRRRSSICSRGS